MFLSVIKLTPEDIEVRLEDDDTFEPPQRNVKRWYAGLGPFGFRLTEYPRLRQPVVGVAMVVGTRIRFEIKGRSRRDVLCFISNWVNSLDPDNLQVLVDFMQYGVLGAPTGRSAWERLDFDSYED